MNNYGFSSRSSIADAPSPLAGYSVARDHDGQLILDGADRYVVFRVKIGPPH